MDDLKPRASVDGDSTSAGRKSRGKPFGVRWICGRASHDVFSLTLAEPRARHNQVDLNPLPRTPSLSHADGPGSVLGGLSLVVLSVLHVSPEALAQSGRSGVMSSHAATHTPRWSSGFMATNPWACQTQATTKPFFCRHSCSPLAHSCAL